MPNFCPSCGHKLNDASARFCPRCGQALTGDTPAPASASDWQVVVGDIPPPPVPSSPATDTSRPSARPRPGKRQEPVQEEPRPEGASLVTPVLTQFAATAWGALPLLGSPMPEQQTQGGGMLLMAAVALIGGLVAKRSRGAASKVTMISSILLVLVQGGSLLPQLPMLLEGIGGGAVAQLAGLGSSLYAAFTAARKRG